MMSREFTKREKLLMLIMCILLIGILYFQFVYKPARESIKKYNTSDLSLQLQAEQLKAQNIRKMNSEMASNKATKAGVVASYNNVKNEIKALNDVFAGAQTFNMNFSEATKDGDAVRRNIDISFTAGSYTAAENILKKLYNCKYRCLIRTINITSSSIYIQPFPSHIHDVEEWRAIKVTLSSVYTEMQKFIAKQKQVGS